MKNFKTEIDLSQIESKVDNHKIIYVCIIMRDNVAYEGFREYDIL